MSRTSNWRQCTILADEIIEQCENSSNSETEGDEIIESVPVSNSSTTESSDDESILLNVSDSETDQSEFGEFDGDQPQPSISCEIREWAIEYNVSNAALSKLLGILQTKGLNVPKDARTLHKTPTSIDVTKKSGGDYVYNGLAACIVQALVDNPKAVDNKEILLKVNVDGVPLFKSVSSQLWPILCSFKNVTPFAVCLFYGPKKPTPVEDYLGQFLDEIATLRANGLEYNGSMYSVQLHSFICDAPARQMLKCVKGHTGYYSCERCEVKGYPSNRRVVIHSDVTEALRTDVKFQNNDYCTEEDDEIVNHQLQISPLAGQFPCVTGFPLEYMHLVCLGVVKRLISFWKKGSKTSKKCKLTLQQFTQISIALCTFSQKMPSEFARRPRGLLEFERWKATEFRQFLLYTGPIVLRSVLTAEYYSHFLALSIAMSILLQVDTELRNSYLPYARELMSYFVRKGGDLYTELFISYNVHSLTHVCDDCEKFQCSLNDISCFEFENFLQILKKKVRSPTNPIVQIAKRTQEAQYMMREKERKISTIRISTLERNGCFQLAGDKFAFVDSIQGDQYICRIVTLHECENFYPAPYNSKLMNVAYCRSSTSRNSKRSLLKRSDFQRKVVCLPHKQGLVLFPLLHNF